MADSTALLTAVANIQVSLEQMKAKLGSHQEDQEPAVAWQPPARQWSS
jgi:hypothetical protein